MAPVTAVQLTVAVVALVAVAVTPVGAGMCGVTPIVAEAELLPVPVATTTTV